MAFRWSVVVHPLMGPLAGALIGWFIGRLGALWCRRTNVTRINFVSSAIGISAAAALTPYGGQILYDLGIAFPTIDKIQLMSYPVLAFTMAAVWCALSSLWLKRMFQALLLVSFGPPLLWACIFIGWEIGGFAP